MNFTVHWSPYPESKLTEIWTHAPDRPQITEAADKIDQRLALDAQAIGESRSGNRRILHEPPLGVIFSVNVDDRTVLVLDVWRYGHRGK